MRDPYLDLVYDREIVRTLWSVATILIEYNTDRKNQTSCLIFFDKRSVTSLQSTT